jgi:hypothetical protein
MIRPTARAMVEEIPAYAGIFPGIIDVARAQRHFLAGEILSHVVLCADWRPGPEPVRPAFLLGGPEVPGAGLARSGGGRPVAAQDLPVGGAGFGAAVGVQGQTSDGL